MEQKELAKKYKINAIPVLIYFKNSKQIYKTQGVKTPKELKQLEKKIFGPIKK